MATCADPAECTAWQSPAVTWAILVVGVACVMTQLALMREMLSAFAGNEMVFGIVLGLWLLLMGLGTMLGRTAQKFSNPICAFVIGQVLVALVPMCQVFALRTLRDVVFVRGSEVDVTGTILGAAVLLMPFCLVAGYTLVLACSILEGANDRLGAGRVYVADSIGSIAGGILFTFVLVHWLDHIALLGVSAMLNLAVASWVALKHAHASGSNRSVTSNWVSRFLLLLPSTGLVLTIVFLAVHPDAFSTALQFKGQKVLFRANSPYGRLIVTDSGLQTNFIENGVVVVYTPNIEQVEQAAHYAMCQRPAARRVLLVSGGATGVAREILKYDAAEVDCVELDPLIVHVTRRFLPHNITDARINVITTDARRFIRRTTNQYDIVILALPDPTTAQLNRFFTAEFFDEVKRILSADGLLCFSLGYYENYISPELARVLASAYRTLRESFQHVLLLPTSRVYFLASNGPLEPDIAKRIEQAGVKAKLVNRNYLEAVLTTDRLADMQRAVLHHASINRDFSPVLYYYALRHWLSQFGSAIGPVQLLLLTVLVCYTVRLRGSATVLFASGFAGSALEVVLLLAFQVLSGAVYQQAGVIVTLFMVGLTAGAAVSNRLCRVLRANYAPAASSPTPAQSGVGLLDPDNSPRVDLRRLHKCRGVLVVLALAICGIAIAMPVLFKFMVPVTDLALGELVVQCCIGLLVLTLGGLVGAQFPLANCIESGGTLTASRLFTADFMGAFLGALLASTLLIPVLGFATSCFVTAGLNLVAAIAMWLAKPPS